jgi:peroxiredoxin
MPRFSRKKDIALVFIILLAGIFIVGYLYTNIERQRHLPPPPIGGQLSPAIVQTLDGKDISTSSFLVKKSVVIFFSTGCTHCTGEIKEVLSLYSMFRDSLNIVAISLSDNEDTKKFVETASISFPVFLDVKREAQKSFHVHTTPSLYFLNAGQRLLKYEFGEQSKKQLLALFLLFANTTPDSTFSKL